MKKEIKEKWLTALRSGEYRQGQKLLCLIIGPEKYHCCLGVLTDIYMKETGEQWEVASPVHNDVLFAHGDAYVLSDKVMEWSGIKSATARFSEIPDLINPPNSKISLTGMNDTGSTFSEIADIIEKYF